MSQRNVELIVGRLATDEDFRARFRKGPEALLRGLVTDGVELTSTEIASILACADRCLEALAASIDPRLQKASLRAPDRRHG